jgi:hypothetical protein
MRAKIINQQENGGDFGVVVFYYFLGLVSGFQYYFVNVTLEP